MKAETVSALHDFTLEARELLEKEISEQLEGIYGLLPNGRLEPIEKYPALKELPEAKETRNRLGQFLEDERAAGVNGKEAREKLTKEAAFTWLNRLVAFKMMESRKLLRQTVSKGPQSNAFLRWLTEPGNEKDYDKYERGDLPQNALGEGPRHEAYRHFLLWQCDQLAQEIRVLFDPDNLASRLCPRPLALGHLIKKMNDQGLKEAWLPGNEETIGWVYQSFNSEELERAFREARLSGKKFEAKDIPSVTQLFTPRWIVRYLVENTLGRLWADMHPDSQVMEGLEYLVPIETTTETPHKPVREIQLLDPACGTLHFGLVAFDLFVRMYQEEMKRAGQPGWPKTPSIENEEEIPAAVIAHNLYGIDIDLRAVQLSALTLYIKAKSMNPVAKLTENKLACADIHMLNSDRLRQFLEEVGIEQPTYRRILTALQDRLKDAEQLGSLLRLEEEIKVLVEKERERFLKEGRQLDLFGWTKEQFESEAGQLEFWGILEVQIAQALNLFAKSQAEKGKDQTFFAGETTKGLRLLEVLSNCYDVVVTNPPYMSNRKMNSRLKTLISQSYPKGKGDLYAAFIERCIELAASHGRVGMLTMHSFMFIGSYERLRGWIRDKAVVETIAHLGPALFSVGNPGTLQTAAHVIRLEPDQEERDEATGHYFRLVKEPNSASKQARFEQALAREEDSIIYRYRQGDFDAIPESPWVYWTTRELRQLFQTLQQLKDIGQPRVGLQTGDNLRFLRYWWEVGRQYVGLAYADAQAARSSGKKWFSYMKGGGFCRWYGNQDCTINWLDDGKELRAFAPRAVVRNANFYFHRGVTYSYLTSGTFSARLSPGGFIFDVAGSSLFPENIPLVLAVMNSSLAAYALKLINPTVNFQVGDLARLPVPASSSTKLRELIDKTVESAKNGCAEDERTYDFVAPPNWETGIGDVEERTMALLETEQEIDKEVYRLYAISEKGRMTVEAELAEDGLVDNESAESGEEEDPSEQTIRLLTQEDLSHQWISYAVGIVMGRFELGVENGLGRGRFQSETPAQLRALADPDAILVMDEGHTDDLPARVLQALTIMVGDEVATEVVKAATGKEGPAEELLRQFMERTFFKVHIQQYRKRPVYWFLQSPKKKYGVWLFHERMNKDTLFRIRTEYVDYKINLLEGHIAELREKRDAAEGREKRKPEKEIGALSDVLDDIREFSKRLEYIIEERGYAPHIDDGVLLNMATLWELIPSWQKEPKKAWEALERGDYDWSYQAMDHWPERVREKCKTNRSYAIAHGLG